MNREIQYESENKSNLGSKVLIASLALATPVLLSAGEAQVKNHLRGRSNIKIYRAGDKGFEHFINKKNSFDLTEVSQAKASILAAYTDKKGKRWASVYDVKDNLLSTRIPMWSKIEIATWKSMGKTISPEELEKVQDNYVRNFKRDESKIIDAFDFWEKNMQRKQEATVTPTQVATATPSQPGEGFLKTLDKYVDAEGYMAMVPLNMATSDSQTSETKYASKFSIDDKVRVQVKVPSAGGELDFVLAHERQGYKNEEFAEELTNTDKRMRIGYLRDVKGASVGAGLTMPGQKFAVNPTDDTNPIAIEVDSKGKGGYALLEVGDSYFLLEASESDVDQKVTNSAVPVSFTKSGRASETRIGIGSEYKELNKIHPSLGRYSLVGAIYISNKRGMIHNREINLNYGVKAKLHEGLNAYLMLRNGMESGKNSLGSSTFGMKMGGSYKFGK